MRHATHSDEASGENELVAKEAAKEALAAQISDLIAFFTKKAPGFVQSQYKNQSLILDKGHPYYISAHYNKCETVRTLIKRDAPTKIEDIYISPDFSIDGEVFSADQVLKKSCIDLDRIVITGLAGSGKSVFLKSCFRHSLENGYTYYPVFFELRTVNRESKLSLLDEIALSISNYVDGFTKSQLVFGLKKGIFFLLIDAIDEAPIHRRSEIVKSVCEISQKYPFCPMMITSRPSEDFNSWEGFHITHLKPFSKDKCLSYIEKIEFDRDRKSEFVEALNNGLFEKHSEFLSNPLLAAMMLLTFDEYGEIPDKRHIFFEKCFQVLLREHDASKGRYRREFHSDSDYADIENIFMFFCALSYLERKFSFSKEDAVAYVSDALEVYGEKLDPSAVLLDLTDSVSILQKDGDYFEFAHRAFQEYFYAKFVTRDREHKLIDKIREIPDISGFDDTILMIADMDRKYFENDFLLPRIRQLIKKFDSIDPNMKPDVILNQFFTWFGVQRRSESGEVVDHEERTLETYFSLGVLSKKGAANRALNIIVFRNLSKYKDVLPSWNESDCKPSEEDLLWAFNASYDSISSGVRVLMGMNHSNRHKLIIAGCGNFATNNQRIAHLS